MFAKSRSKHRDGPFDGCDGACRENIRDVRFEPILDANGQHFDVRQIESGDHRLDETCFFLRGFE